MTTITRVYDPALRRHRERYPHEMPRWQREGTDHTGPCPRGAHSPTPQPSNPRENPLSSHDDTETRLERLRRFSSDDLQQRIDAAGPFSTDPHTRLMQRVMFERRYERRAGRGPCFPDRNTR